jgi:hypothetical protein
VLARYARQVVAVQNVWGQMEMAAVGLTGVIVFFAAYALAATLAYLRYRERAVLIWVSAMLAATSFLAFNHLWHWSNHPYRFAIHLIFPLGVLAALGLRHGPRPLAIALGAWLAVVCLADAGSFLAGRRIWVRFRVGEPERAAFLGTVRTTTSSLAGTGLRILAPAEVGYPRGVFQAAVLMNYSRVQAFVPDYRHVLWRERYYNRMGLFCYLFPGFPNYDLPFNRRACDEALDPDPALVEIRDPRLKTTILPLYSIGLAGAPGKPFASFLKGASARYEWPVVAETDSSELLRTIVSPLRGVARLLSGSSTSTTLSIVFEVETPGRHLVILGGRKLAARAPRIALDGRVLSEGRRSTNWGIFSSDLGAGRHRLDLPSLDSGPESEADYLYFASLIHEDWTARYLVLPVQGAREQADGRPLWLSPHDQELPPHESPDRPSPEVQPH